MNKNIKFNDEIARLIQQYAETHTNGNFTAAVNVICATYLRDKKDEGRSNRK